MSDQVSVSVDGKDVLIEVGASAAACVQGATRRSASGELRGPLCGMGVCHECRLTIDGVANQRSCMVSAADGMRIDTANTHDAIPRATSRTRFRDVEVAIVGAGPAGLRAAEGASRSGASVLVIDENPLPGGQIWRGNGENLYPIAEFATKPLRSRGVRFLQGATVIDRLADGELLVSDSDGVIIVEAGSIVVATGSRELFLPFPGWTLPNVMGAGGLQAMVKSGLPIDGKRVVIGGSGPLLIAVSLFLRQHGARVLVLAEQTPLRSLLGFGLRAATKPSKAVQALRLLPETARTVSAGTWVKCAVGRDRLEAVFLAGRRRDVVECDYLACGYGLVPNLELPMLLGCEIKNGFVEIDGQMQTSVPGVFCAGELTGISGFERSAMEGLFAGVAAAGRRVSSRFAVGQDSFGQALSRAFRLRSEVLALADDDTVVCRCEDVRYSELKSFQTFREAKLATRCGMGPCQGRICGAALRELEGWEYDRIRPPLAPAPARALACSKRGDSP